MNDCDNIPRAALPVVTQAIQAGQGAPDSFDFRLYNTLTGTFPLHVHCPRLTARRLARDMRPRRIAFERLRALVRKATTPALRPVDISSERLEIVTCKTYRVRSPLELSLRKLGLQPIVYQRPKSTWYNRRRLQIYLEHCHRSTAEFVLFSDASDVLLLASPTQILVCFLSLHVEALLSAERGNHPKIRALTCSERALSRGTYPFGNAGGLIGRRSKLIELFELAQTKLLEKKRSDQGAIRIACLELGVPRDNHCQLFQNLGYITPGEIKIVACESPRRTRR